MEWLRQSAGVAAWAWPRKVSTAAAGGNKLKSNIFSERSRWTDGKKKEKKRIEKKETVD